MPYGFVLLLGIRSAVWAGMVEGLFSNENYNIASKLLDATHLRHKALSANLANVNTPGYKRVDIAGSFDEAMQSAMRRGDVTSIQQVQPQLAVDTLSTATRPDGNNVVLDKELLEINKNALAYEFLSQRVASSFSTLKTAITGQSK